MAARAARYRALITGAAGQLGGHLARLLPEAAALGRAELDITDADAVARAVANVEVVFNCAAYNGVDAAEADPGPAQAVNAAGPRILAAACRESGARLVHFSTNYVFDGSGDRPWTEADTPRPLGAYGRSKREGEAAVLDELPSALVVRTAGVFAASGSAVKGGSFPDRVRRWALAGDPLRIVADQHLNPTYAGHLAAAAVDLLAAELAGVVHLVAEGCCSWHELAVETLHVAGVEAPVQAIASADFPTAAPRPLNGCLGSVRVAPLPSWRSGLREWWADAAAVSAPS